MPCACRSVLLGDPLPPLVLGPESSSWVHQQFLETNASTTTYEQALQLALMEHALGQPLSCLTPAVASGSHQKLQAAIQQLSPSQLERCSAALAAAEQRGGGAGAAAGARKKGTASGRGRGERNPEPAAVGEEVQQLMDGVWSAMMSYSDWRTGLLLLQTLADLTGRAPGGSDHRTGSSLWHQQGWQASITKGFAVATERYLEVCNSTYHVSVPARTGVLTAKEEATSMSSNGTVLQCCC
jgi:hypothetical protein